MRRRPSSTLFPYTTLFRSVVVGVVKSDKGARLAPGGEDVAAAYGRKLAPLLSTLGVTGKAGETAKIDRKSTRLNSSHMSISYAVFCLKKKKIIPIFILKTV